VLDRCGGLHFLTPKVPPAILHLGQLRPGTVTAAVVAVNGLIAEAWIISPYFNPNKDLSRTAAAILNIRPHAVMRGYLGIAAGLLIVAPVGFALYSQPLIEPLSAKSGHYSRQCPE